MYYEEKLENGILYCRSDPHGEWKEMSYADVVAKYRASNHASNVAYQLANDRKQQIADLTAERNAWREDADALVARSNHQPSCEIFKPLGLTCTCGWSQAMNNHIQLHERYSTEKSDTAKGE